jgi:hypothetical protein
MVSVSELTLVDDFDVVDDLRDGFCVKVCVEPPSSLRGTDNKDVILALLVLRNCLLA